MSWWWQEAELRRVKPPPVRPLQTIYPFNDIHCTTAPTLGGFLGIADCYLRGTRILTVDGEVPVEDLSDGDLIITASGATCPVKWIGKRGYVRRLMSQHQRDSILPIRFVHGSLGEGAAQNRRGVLISA